MYYKNLFQLSKSIELTNMSLRYVNHSGSLIFRGEAKDDSHFTSVENLRLRNNTKTKTLNMGFLVATTYKDNSKYNLEELSLKEIKDLNFRFNLVVGLRLDKNEKLVNVSNFIRTLKENDIIPTYDFTFEFRRRLKYDPTTPDDTIGNLIFGNFDEVFNRHKKYKVEKVKITKFVPDSTAINYVMNLTEVFIESEKTKK